MKMRCGLRFKILIDVARKVLDFLPSLQIAYAKTKNFEKKKKLQLRGNWQIKTEF